jgi:hypothetical protein
MGQRHSIANRIEEEISRRDRNEDWRLILQLSNELPISDLNRKIVGENTLLNYVILKQPVYQYGWPDLTPDQVFEIRKEIITNLIDRGAVVSDSLGDTWHTLKRYRTMYGDPDLDYEKSLELLSYAMERQLDRSLRLISRTGRRRIFRDRNLPLEIEELILEF